MLKKIKEYFGITGLTGGAIGTGITYWLYLIGRSTYDLIFYKIPLALSEQNVYRLIEYSPDILANASKAAFAGGVVGMVLTTKLKRRISELLWR